MAHRLSAPEFWYIYHSLTSDITRDYYRYYSVYLLINDNPWLFVHGKLPGLVGQFPGYQGDFQHVKRRNFTMCNIFWYPVNKIISLILFYGSSQSISPGFVDTEIFDAAKQTHSKMKPSDILKWPEEMADMICFVMSTGPNILVTKII